MAATKETRELVRLTEEQFLQLKKQLPSSACTSTTTPTQAAWQLGVAHVLELLRDGFVV